MRSSRVERPDLKGLVTPDELFRHFRDHKGHSDLNPPQSIQMRYPPVSPVRPRTDRRRPATLQSHVRTSGNIIDGGDLIPWLDADDCVRFSVQMDMGVNSLALIIYLVQRGLRIDQVVYPVTGAESPETLALIPLVQRWLKEAEAPPLEVLRLGHVKGFSQKPYDGLPHFALAHGARPLASLRAMPLCCDFWRQGAVEEADREIFDPEIPRASASSQGRVRLIIRALPLCNSPQDLRAAQAIRDLPQAPYLYTLPLLDSGMTPQDCIDLVVQEGFPVHQIVPPVCWCCPSQTSEDVVALALRRPQLARLAVAMEAASFLQDTPDSMGLWGAPVRLGLRRRPARFSTLLASPRSGLPEFMLNPLGVIAWWDGEPVDPHAELTDFEVDPREAWNIARPFFLLEQHAAGVAASAEHASLQLLLETLRQSPGPALYADPLGWLRYMGSLGIWTSWGLPPEVDPDLGSPPEVLAMVEAESGGPYDHDYVRHSYRYRLLLGEVGLPPSPVGRSELPREEIEPRRPPNGLQKLVHLGGTTLLSRQPPPDTEAVYSDMEDTQLEFDFGDEP